MKLKGIWIAIGLILMVGIFSTSYVKKRTADGFEKTVTESISAKENSKEKIYMSDTRTEEDSEKIRIQKIRNTGPEAEILSEQESSDRDGADSGISKDRTGESGDGKETSNTALVRLQELDEQIARNRAGETEMTANSQKASAESEWRLWETEMQRSLTFLKDSLDQEHQEELMKQQKEWMRSREIQAVNASQKQLGSTLEEIGYSRSLAESTRARAYELAETYEDFFDETLQPQ